MPSWIRLAISEPISVPKFALSLDDRAISGGETGRVEGFRETVDGRDIVRE